MKRGLKIFLLADMVAPEVGLAEVDEDDLGVGLKDDVTRGLFRGRGEEAVAQTLNRRLERREHAIFPRCR